MRRRRPYCAACKTRERSDDGHKREDGDNALFTRGAEGLTDGAVHVDDAIDNGDDQRDRLQ